MNTITRHRLGETPAVNPIAPHLDAIAGSLRDVMASPGGRLYTMKGGLVAGGDIRWKPVNLIAAKLLWKAPWWAKYPEPAKAVIVKLPLAAEWSAWVDFTKSAPIRKRPPWDSRPHPQITERRGHILRWRDGTEAMVIGYADEVARVINTRKYLEKPPWWVGGGWDPRRPHREIRILHAWWVVIEDKIERVVFKQQSARKFRDITAGETHNAPAQDTPDEIRHE